jgi:hypothetical protein
MMVMRVEVVLTIIVIVHHTSEEDIIEHSRALGKKAEITVRW